MHSRATSIYDLDCMCYFTYILDTHACGIMSIRFANCSKAGFSTFVPFAQGCGMLYIVKKLLTKCCNAGIFFCTCAILACYLFHKQLKTSNAAINVPLVHSIEVFRIYRLYRYTRVLLHAKYVFQIFYSNHAKRLV